MNKDSILAGFGTLRRFAPCPSGHITADKRLRFTSPKLPSATSLIRKPLCERASQTIKELI